MGRHATGGEITEKGAVLFLELARRSTSDVRALADAIGESVADTRSRLRELSALGLLTQDSPDAPWEPVDPVGPLRKLITEAERDMSSARSRKDDLSNLEDRLSRAYGFHLERQAEDRAIEVIHGVEAANERLWQLSQLENAPSLSMNPGPQLLSEEMLERAIQSDLARIERGLRDRMIIDHARLTGPGLADPFVVALAQAGQPVRIASTLPIRCVVSARWAALPLIRGDDGTGGVMIVHASSIVLALEALFESIWRTAQPLVLDHGGSMAPGIDVGIDPPAELLLNLLATGMPDEAIARYLDTSPRTVRRRIKDLSEQLGVGTRFQLALAATTHGWRAADGPAHE